MPRTWKGGEVPCVRVMAKYRERLEVRLTAYEYQYLKEYAAARGISMGQLVREALDRQYGMTQDRRDLEKQRALEKLFAVDAPVDDWTEMEAQIEKGRARG